MECRLATPKQHKNMSEQDLSQPDHRENPPTVTTSSSDPVYSCDWPEDFPHENGNYFCVCTFCNVSFRGYKRRVVCKRCYDSGMQTDVERLQSTVSKLNEECRILREALEKIYSMSKTMDQYDADLDWIEDKCSRSLESTPLTAKYQAKVEAMEKVVKAARKMAPNEYSYNTGFLGQLARAIAALDTLSEKEER